MTGLTKDDFLVTLDGQPRPVRALDYETFGGEPTAVSAGAPAATTTTTSNDVATASRGGRVFLLVVDDLSASPLQMKGLLVSAEKMLDSLGPNDMVGLVTTSGLGPAISPTRDRAQVLAMLRDKALAGRMDPRLTNPYVTISEAFDIARPMGDRDTLVAVLGRECGASVTRAARFGGASQIVASVDGPCPSQVLNTAKRMASESEQRMADQIAAYIHAIDALRGAPVPRTIIALTGGIGFHIGEAGVLDPVSVAAAEANVTFQGLIAVDDMDLAIDTSPERAKARRDEGNFMINGMQTVAYAAGGSAFRVVGQADRFYTRIVTEASGLYHLGVEAPSTVKPERYLSLKVSVKKSGVTVHTNSHAVQPAVAVEKPPVADQLKQRVEQGGAAFGVPLAVTTARRKDPTSNRVQILVNVDVPASAPGPVSEMFAMLNSNGHVVQSATRDMPAAPAGEDYRLTFAVPLDAGDYRLRVAVGDGNGSVGSLEQAVAARLTPVGSLPASDLTIVDVAADGPHLLGKDTLPPHSLHAQVSLELYPSNQTGTAGLTVHLTVTPADHGAPLIDTDLECTVRDGHILASGMLSPATIPVGEYDVVATVRAGGHTVGSVSARLRKVQ